jgi:hypothetical protein
MLQLNIHLHHLYQEQRLQYLQQQEQKLAHFPFQAHLHLTACHSNMPGHSTSISFFILLPEWHHQDQTFPGYQSNLDPAEGDGSMAQCHRSLTTPPLFTSTLQAIPAPLTPQSPTTNTTQPTTATPCKRAFAGPDSPYG